MKTQAILATLLLSSVVVNAQQVTVSAAQPAGRAQYDEATNTVVEPQAQVIETRANPVIILNNQRLQEQPTTVVEASPLMESNAERMRKQRQGLEVNTEQRIVEKLEEARMEDERARAERLFGTGCGTAKPAPAPAPAPAPVAELARSPKSKAQ